MLHPPTAKTWQEFRDLWKFDRTHGQRVAEKDGSIWYHDGLDINFHLGGASDDGMPVYALSDGQIAYWHLNTHTNKLGTYGCHCFLKFKAPWGGNAWAHYAHLQHGTMRNNASIVKAGDVIGHIGKTGTYVPHLHLSLLIKDPVGNIDRWARTKAELDEWWIDPLDFFMRWGGQPATGGEITQDTYIPYLNMTPFEARNTIHRLENKLEQVRLVLEQS